MQISVRRLRDDAILPSYAHAGDAGLDVFASEETIVPARGRAAVPTGIAMALPEGFAALVWDKSGLATRAGITTIAGVLDAGYRGEYLIAVANLSDTDYVFKKGDKVAQILFQKVERAELFETSDLPESERGANGFGSTGK